MRNYQDWLDESIASIRAAVADGYRNGPQPAPRMPPLMRTLLRFSVPMYAARHKNDPHVEYRAAAVCEMLTHGGAGALADAMAGEATGQPTRDAFNLLAEALGILALRPGGVEWMGEKWDL